MSNAYQPEFVRYGIGGLDLRSAVDMVRPGRFTRLQNVVRLEHGGFTARPGQTSLATGGTKHHSIKRLNDPQGGTFTRIWGIDTSLYHGQSGALTSAESGFSGNPLSLVPYRPPLSGDTWMYVGDSSKMRKIRADGLDLPIGLPKPGAITTALAAELTTAIEACESGFAAINGTAGGAPTLTYPAGKSANALNIQTTVGAVTSSYYTGADKAITADLSSVGGSPASDDDLIHLWLKVDRPDRIVDVKIYFVCSTFTAGAIPGTSTTQNTDAFVKSFRPNDFTVLVEQQAGPVTSGERRIIRRLIDEGLPDIDDPRGGSTNTRLSQREPSRGASEELVAGRGQWTEFGVVSVPLRRGDFLRIGSDEAVGWNTITGITVIVQTTGAFQVNVSLDDLYLRGGRGLDTSEPGSAQYDYRVTNYDPRTGAESNGSDVQAAGNFLDSLRRAITITPPAFGDAAVRQRIYRRGGRLTDNWYFVAANTSDGGAYTDTSSDTAIEASATLPTDHYQPAPTVDENGATVLAQPLPYLWGPVADLLFGAGDPYRPGHVYHCIPGEPDHWAADGYVEVCSPSEQIMNGCVWGGQAYTWSRERLYALYPNLSGAGAVTAAPTGCTKGLAANWAFAVGAGGMFFVSVDGIYLTTGGPEVNLTDDDVRGLFHGETRHGYLPVDFTQTTALRLEVHDNELWFAYQDTGGTRRVLVLNLIDRQWRWNTFSKAVNCLYSEVTGGASTLLMGGVTGGTTYTHTGTSDGGDAITCIIRTGALDQGNPRADKLYGDAVFEFDRQSTNLAITPYINAEATVLTTDTISTGSGRQRHVYNFGTSPRRAKNLSWHVEWSSTTNRPIVYFLSHAFLIEPDQVEQRGIDWEDLGDTYYTGLDLDCDTFGVDKTIEVYVDQTSIGTFTVNANGRALKHLTFGPGRGHLYRFVPTDTDPWILYSHKWWVDPEPTEQANWNQNYTLEGTLADKYVKGVLLAVDTNGIDKTVQIQGDGVVQTTITVNGTQADRAKHYSFAQFRARTLRLLPTDSNPGRIYQPPQWIFDEEPYSLSRWETQELDHGYAGWQIPLKAFITLRSTSEVTLSVTIYNQSGAVVATRLYTLASTGGAKVKKHVPFHADKGVLFKYTFTASTAFHLYREESSVVIQPWGQEDLLVVRPFGNDDLDRVRGMQSAMLTAARSNTAA